MINHLNITRLDISFVVSVVSQLLQSPYDSPRNEATRIWSYVKGAPREGLLSEEKKFILR